MNYWISLGFDGVTVESVFNYDKCKALNNFLPFASFNKWFNVNFDIKIIDVT